MLNIINKRVIVCEKDALTSARIVRVAQELGLQVVAETRNAADTVIATKLFQPDFLFLDLRMKDTDGVRCAQQVAEVSEKTAIIFTTNFDQFAINCFQQNGIGYAVKPVNKEQVLEQLSAVKVLSKKQLSDILILENPTVRPTRQHITARDRKGTVIINIKDIHCFVADQKYVDIHHKDGIIPTTETLKDLETEFSDLFMRVHRNAIVNINHLESVDAVNGGQHRVRLKDCDSKVTVSRRLLPKVREKLRAM